MQNISNAYGKARIKALGFEAPDAELPRLWLETIFLFNALGDVADKNELLFKNNMALSLRTEINPLADAVVSKIKQLKFLTTAEYLQHLENISTDLSKFTQMTNRYKNIICDLLAEDMFKTNSILKKADRVLMSVPFLIRRSPNIVKLRQKIFFVARSNFSKIVLSGGTTKMDHARIHRHIAKYSNGVDEALLSFAMSKNTSQGATYQTSKALVLAQNTLLTKEVA